MKISDSSIIDVNNLGEKELNEFVFQCLSLLTQKSNDKKINQNKYKIMEGFFELIYFFEEIEEYEKCATLKKVKDSLLIDL